MAIWPNSKMLLIGKSDADASVAQLDVMEKVMKKILVLGPGCAKCVLTEKIVREVVDASEVSAEVTKISDVMEMIRLGVMSTPAVIIDGKVVCSGRVPTADQVRAWLEEGAAESPSDGECGGCGCACR